ncbi:hypothetical protein PLICRDRAFT_217263 [Plicaturopsis crispa FD-325 SS-3]|nr:hypothetical protein PLICRDRAFT_217263 [Plicaturopsis crispa FD-325 SS-3]
MALKLNLASSPLSEDLYQELGASVRGSVYLRDDPNYLEYTKIFNGNVKTSAKAVVCPLDAADVSKIILFCKKHSLSPSVKAGGYGTGGWAIGGDIVMDLSQLADIDIETPKPDGTFTSLAQIPACIDQSRVGDSAQGGKRRREEDSDLRTYSSAASAVALFLGSPLSSGSRHDGPSASVRRRIQSHDAAPLRLPSDESVSSAASASARSSSGVSTSATSRSSSSSAADEADKPSSVPAAPSSDPFGYLNATPSRFPPAPPPGALQTTYTSQASFSPWSGNVFGSMMPSVTDSALATLSRPVHKYAYVTFGAGRRQKEIDQFTASRPLEATALTGQSTVIPYHVPTAAHPVGSSIMLLGGFGFLSRLHGLSVDNLVEVEMVLADGKVVIVSEKENTDLWWAIRGAGTVFGVATRYKAKAFPVPIVFAGNIIYRFHRATAPSLIQHFRDCIKNAPRELYANCLLTAGPAGKDSLVVIQICYVGPREKGTEYLKALSSWDGEPCLLNEVAEKSFLTHQDSVAQVLRGKAGRHWFIRSALISSLPDSVINQTVMQFADAPVGCTWLFELAGGAIADFEDTCLPKAQREAKFTVAALHQWDVGVEDPRCILSAEEWIHGTLKNVSTGGPFPSFLGRHEAAQRTMSVYGDNWERLASLKRKYDPDNLFRNTFWPLDAAGEPVDAHTHEPPTP